MVIIVNDQWNPSELNMKLILLNFFLKCILCSFQLGIYLKKKKKEKEIYKNH